MTLNEYIEMLTNLRDHHNAGDFKMRVREVVTDVNVDDYCVAVEDWDWTDMDGDDFLLNLEEKTVNVDCKTYQIK
jgi:hypothetical protein